MYVLQEEERGRVSVPLMVVATSRKHYPTSFSTEGAALEKIPRSEIESENYQGVRRTKEKK